MYIYITVNLNADSRSHPFFPCLCATFLCPDYRARQTCEVHRLQCTHCQPLGLQVPNVIISSLARSSRQCKLCSAKCLQTFLFLFFQLFLKCIFSLLSVPWHRRICKVHPTHTQLPNPCFSPSLHYSTCFQIKEPWA